MEPLDREILVRLIRELLNDSENYEKRITALEEQLDVICRLNDLREMER